MQVLSLLVHDDWGVMQRIASVFTRKRISIETIIAGPCELAGRARVILASSDPKIPKVVEHLRRVHDVIEVECIEKNAQELVLVRTTAGPRLLAGEPDEVERGLARHQDTAFVRVYGAL